LVHALPDHVVLAQVSFGALLSVRASAVRNTYDRKRADYVVCDRAFVVAAVIELDDGSHKDKEELDEKRDLLLTNAGYRVIRYRNIPDEDQVQADFEVRASIPLQGLR
jgi:very-short-patch-repair endonuclease